MDKAFFITNLCSFYKIHTDNNLGIEELVYYKEKYFEWLYVIYPSNDQKRINITGDNTQGIWLDFSRFMADPNRFEWLMDPKVRIKPIATSCGICSHCIQDGEGWFKCLTDGLSYIEQNNCTIWEKEEK